MQLLSRDEDLQDQGGRKVVSAGLPESIQGSRRAHLFQLVPLKHFARDRFDNLAARVLRRAKHETLLGGS